MEQKAAKNIYKVQWPTSEVLENFSFSTVHPDGIFTFQFKWFNDRWNLWVTLPDGSKRAAGVLPGVLSWSGFLDYGLLFDTNLETIDFNQLFMTELYLVTWE